MGEVVRLPAQLRLVRACEAANARIRVIEAAIKAGGGDPSKIVWPLFRR